MLIPSSLSSLNQASINAFNPASLTASSLGLLSPVGSSSLASTGLLGATSTVQSPGLGLNSLYGPINNGQHVPPGQANHSLFGNGGNGFGMFSMMSSMLELMMMMFQQFGGSGFSLPAASATPVSTTPVTTTPVVTTPVVTTPVPTPTPTPTPTPVKPTDINITQIESVSSPHNSEVLNVLKSQVATDDINQLFTQVPSTVNTPTNLNEFKQFIANDYTEPLNVATSNLQKVINGNDPANRVVNMSFGRTGLFTMNFAKDALRANPQLLADMGLPTNSDLNSPQVNMALTNLLTTELSNNPTVKSAMQNYQNTVAQASQKGIVVVVAGGNDQQTLQTLQSQGINIDPAWSMNNLTFSNNVIVSGAIDTKNTAATNDDTLTSFGSMGSSSLRPTLGANAVAVNGNSALNGTSFSTPQIAATAQKMLEIDSKLTAAQVKSILLSTSSYSVSGLPVLDSAKAIAEAQRLALLG